MNSTAKIARNHFEIILTLAEYEKGHGKHEAQEESKKCKTVYSERSPQQILRVVDLPAEVDSSKGSATLKDGISKIELPKAAHAKTDRIEPKAAQVVERRDEAGWLQTWMN